MKRSSDNNSLYVEQPTKKLCLGEFSEDEVIITLITSDEKPIKKVCLGESSEDEVTITRITSTSAYNDSEDNGSSTLQNTEDIITHLPEELLECILMELSYCELSKARQVCRRFRDTGDDIFSRHFRIVKNYVESKLADVVKGKNARLEGTFPATKALILIRQREALNEICNQFRLLSYVKHQLLFHSDVDPNIRHSQAFFEGNFMDEVHRILRIVILRPTTDRVQLMPLRALFNKWIRLFIYRIDSHLTQRLCALDEPTYPDLLGLTDLLKYCLNGR
jgi:hypothetical protein